MPISSKVHKMYEALKEKGFNEASAAKISQKKTGLSLKTGLPPKPEKNAMPEDVPANFLSKSIDMVMAGSGQEASLAGMSEASPPKLDENSPTPLSKTPGDRDPEKYDMDMVQKYCKLGMSEQQAKQALGYSKKYESILDTGLVKSGLVKNPNIKTEKFPGIKKNSGCPVCYQDKCVCQKRLEGIINGS